jgi:hypothetical protein
MLVIANNCCAGVNWCIAKSRVPRDETACLGNIGMDLLDVWRFR